MPAWCQRDHCRRYGKHNGMCLYHARDVQALRSARPSLDSPATTSSDASASPIATAQPQATAKSRRPDARWSAISRIRYHHTGWIKCLVPTCASEAKRHYPFCPMHEQSTLCVHETTKQYLQPKEAATATNSDLSCVKEEAMAPVAS
ncbi:hypothetical protein SPRG_11571 [Saprolegnia parasitica CBS 223.65]|uniref:Uncharacterized protein n=1 Tax=Saprolegnia parasitica (strain CBS 223.65) TaxID=695850 RepID=A0A067C7N3_SAPPC|nr:hypothetical protein SPRG_11571 [Saprolegnia parasitica CBS 223.65]KDO22812.1 hypothetical protein SPRG_11571 [Saprolegnia parasitica CBS 223.65]|eukprot:XP_012206483.1 hypothetical protein SPRG_11571 [Saprolegnia parasitica CBS 223.65]